MFMLLSCATFAQQPAAQNPPAPKLFAGATDVTAMIRDNNAVVIRLNTEAMRAKMQPLYAELIKEKALSKDLFDAVNALPH